MMTKSGEFLLTPTKSDDKGAGGRKGNPTFAGHGSPEAKSAAYRHKGDIQRQRA